MKTSFSPWEVKMGLFSNFNSAYFKGKKAYRLHIEGNQAIDKGDFSVVRAKHDEALTLYKEAYDGGNRDSAIVMAYAVLLMRYGKCDIAKGLLNECKNMKLDPKSKKQLRVNYAVCQWKLGDLDNAISNLEYASGDGATAVIMTTLGYLYIERALRDGNFDKALEYNTNCLDYDDEDGGILDNLGQLYLAMGKTDEAYDYFAKAYKFKPTQAPTLYYIAKINLERGNLEKAKGFIDKCMNSNFSALCTITVEQAEELKKQIYSKL